MLIKLNGKETVRIENTDEIRNELTERNQEQGRSRCAGQSTVVNGRAFHGFLFGILILNGSDVSEFKFKMVSL